MHGAGNDFVMVAAADLPTGGLDRATIARICDRRRGVGGDGLIVVAPPDIDRSAASADDVDFVMTYYNSDGGEAEMCGNGARCAVAFARALGFAGETCRFATRAGVVAGRARGEEVEVALTPWRDLALGVAVEGSPFAEHHTCDTGVPHLVIPVADVDAVDVAAAGSALRGHALFAPRGTNVDWVSPVVGGEGWRLRTFERGVEAETLACGTGAAAAAVVLIASGRAATPVTLLTRGGDRLSVTVDETAKELRLCGPATTVFRGAIVLAAGSRRERRDSSEE
jgi:diaminopimelate epimerase